MMKKTLDTEFLLQKLVFKVQIITIHKLSHISRSRGNQTMKFGQLIEYNMRNIFLENSYTKCGKKLVPDPFIKNQN